MRHFVVHRWLFLIVILATLTSSIAQPSIQTSIQTTCTETTGRIERPTYRSSLVETDMVYSIYLPPCYDQTTQQYPTIYLMHGSNDDDHHWLRLGLQELLDSRITAGEMPPVIVVLPFGNWIANKNQFGTYSWENVFMTEMLPLVEVSYRVETRKEFRAIGGISRGGFWAFQIGLLHPDLFSTIGGHSAFFDRFNAPVDYNPLDLALGLTPETAPRIALDRGAADYAAPGLDIMDERLTSVNIPHTYTIYPEGEHNNLYWEQHVDDYLDFYTEPWLTTAPISPEIVSLTETPTSSEPVAFITSTPRPTASAPDVSTSSSGNYLILPVVAFPSRLVNLDRNTLLQVIQGGELNRELVLTQSVADVLKNQGFIINPVTQIVPDDQLYKSLWGDRTHWTFLPFDQLTTRYRVLWINEQNPLYDLDNYPLLFASATPNFDLAKLTRILLSGVTAMTRRSIPTLDEKGMIWAGEAIAPITTRADFFHTS
ncbi:MAG TPA: alpha/beta hydrolase-fold protein, partial [Phototrophicaceae bacterium]|nr:alpha/beta hydrolase-fold protein [Phototrophicaceae bacterium]